jgi:Lon protease-like protein
MTATMPLFPLGTVLYPGLVLPLHIFEERYRQLVRDLLARPEPRCFGVVAIRKGRETGIDGVAALHQIGCTATLHEVTPFEDGRYQLVTVGTQRFRLLALDQSLPYLQGEIDLLAEETGDEAAAALAARAVQQALGEYLAALAAHQGTQLTVPELAGEPVLLSYLVAATMIVDLTDRQLLLAEPDAAARLAAERVMLTRETAMLRTLPSTPATDLRNSPYNPN